MILSVVGRYPPGPSGGYELRCAATNGRLAERGHTVEVLTSSQVEPQPDLQPVLRRARPAGELGPLHRSIRKVSPTAGSALLSMRHVGAYIHNGVRVGRVTSRVRPQVAMCWSVSRIGLAPAAVLARRGIPVVYMIGDFWIARHWAIATGRYDMLHALGVQPGTPGSAVARDLGRLGEGIHRPLMAIGRHLRFEHAVFVSEFMRRRYADVGLAADHSAVVYHGVRFEPPQLADLHAPKPHSLVYVGRVVRNKGIHVAFEALRLIRDQPGLHRATLTVIGECEPRYLAELRALARQLGIERAVSFLGWTPPEGVYRLLPAHRVLLWPSLWAEPAGVTQLEAMGHGVPVVAADVGAVRETITDGVNGLLVPAGDAAAMAQAAATLMTDDIVWLRLRREGLERVRREFTEGRYIDEVEDFLAEVAPARV